MRCPDIVEVVLSELTFWFLEFLKVVKHDLFAMIIGFLDVFRMRVVRSDSSLLADFYLLELC